MSNLISIILIVASAGVLLGYVNPTYRAMTGNQALSERSVKELEAERARYLDALQKTKEIEQVRTGLLERYNSIPAEDRARIEKLLPDHIDSVRLIIDINAIASRYEMSLKSLSLAQAESGAAPRETSIGPSENRFKAMQLKFSVSGSYENFRSFISNLEQSLRLTDIEAISFTASKDPYDYTVTISTYRLTAEKHARF